ncbi:death-associated protein kinase 1-like isoform X1 [Chironomus tepperi]|uniref:death-associated protein kinase 1-like isoform X1 n=1 Tax=Chironomus tepperi TaxID=113505 RepID=UPI00391F6FDD
MIKVDETDPVGEIEPQFPYRQVNIKRGEDIKEYFDLCEEIGRGKFGTVYKCKEKSTKLCLAAKFIAVPNRKERKNVERELDMMNRLHHPRIIQLYDAYEYNKMVCVVLELIEGGELFDRVLDDKFILTEKACSIFMRQICEAMEYIHDQNIIHLDLKPENILCLSESGNRIKLIDFGLSREYDPTSKLQVLFGTPEFVAPEVVNFDAITFATDMWSVGVIAYVLVSGLSPFAGECDVETMGNVTVGKYDFNDEAFDNVSQDCIDFVTKLLVKEQDDRLTAKQALRHRWIKKKPQYHPTNPKPSNPLSFKAVYMDKDNTLITAKDNLRNCVDRWNDSTPYVFDKHSNSISPVHASISSSIDTSPTPSLNSSSASLAASDENDNTPMSLHDNDKIINTNINSSTLPKLHLTTNQNEAPSIVSLKDYLHILDRHKSIDNCFLLPSGVVDGSYPCYYDDEIKKLTNHLFEITKNHYSETETPTTTTTTTKPDNSNNHNVNGKNVCLTSNRIVDDNNNKIDDSQMDQTHETSMNDDDKRNNQFTEIFKKFTKLTDDSSIVSNVPWAVTKRTKFRINQTSSRDVPIVRTEKPAKLKKQNAIDDGHDMKLFDETINHTSRTDAVDILTGNKIVDFLDETFSNKTHHHMFQSVRHETFVGRLPNGSVSFDCGQLGEEQRSINTIKALFRLHASTGTSVKHMQALIESKRSK